MAAANTAPRARAGARGRARGAAPVRVARAPHGPASPPRAAEPVAGTDACGGGRAQGAAVSPGPAWQAHALAVLRHTLETREIAGWAVPACGAVRAGRPRPWRVARAHTVDRRAVTVAAAGAAGPTWALDVTLQPRIAVGAVAGAVTARAVRTQPVPPAGCARAPAARDVACATRPASGAVAAAGALVADPVGVAERVPGAGHGAGGRGPPCIAVAGPCVHACAVCAAGGAAPPRALCVALGAPVARGTLLGARGAGGLAGGAAGAGGARDAQPGLALPAPAAHMARGVPGAWGGAGDPAPAFRTDLGRVQGGRLRLGMA